jgi:hypothetical protein
VDRPTVVIELADHPNAARDIAAGGVFVPGCTFAINSECALIVRGGAEEIELVARVVYVDAKTGAGLELVGFTPAMREHLTRIMTAWSAPSPPEAAPDAETETELTEEEKADPAKRRHALNLHERLRGLTLAQQVKAASSPDPQERILLERFYNKNVWEPLLRNPRLTPPEVARMARLGSLPKHLLEIIVSNGAWLQMPEVRRSLLANPRLSTDQIVRVLRMLPKHELKLAMTQTAYPYAVRDAARRLMKDLVGDR